MFEIVPVCPIPSYLCPRDDLDFKREIIYLDGDWTLQVPRRPSEVDMQEREKVKHLAVLYVKSDGPSEEAKGSPGRGENEA